MRNGIKLLVLPLLFASGCVSSNDKGGAIFVDGYDVFHSTYVVRSGKQYPRPPSYQYIISVCFKGGVPRYSRVSAHKEDLKSIRFASQDSEIVKGSDRCPTNKVYSGRFKYSDVSGSKNITLSIEIGDDLSFGKYKITILSDVNEKKVVVD